MTLTGKGALDLVNEVRRENDQKRADALARAKADAAATGKEPFDYTKLEAACIPEVLEAVPAAGRAAHWEHWYYVVSPNVMTLRDLADELNATAGY